MNHTAFIYGHNCKVLNFLVVFFSDKDIWFIMLYNIIEFFVSMSNGSLLYLYSHRIT